MLLSLKTLILGYPLSRNITGFISLREWHLWDLMLKVVNKLLSYVVTEQLLIFLDLVGLF